MAADILDQIHTEHELVQNLFKEILQTSTGSVKTREKLFTELKKNLIPHMKSEEELFYPLLKEHRHTKEMSLEALEEHHVAEMVLSELDRMAPSDENWNAKIKVLSELIEHHIEEEESEVFKGARDIIPQKLEPLLNQFVEKENALKSQL
ncbi:hemerythrin HHE cation-binding protein [Chitinispirillum alkaliphilum]|nr:hemerythrin HHE cation-binding protein [Chitinispirillum alkaliphilum]